MSTFKPGARNPRLLYEEIEELLRDREGLEVSLCWPAHITAEGETDEQARAQAKRLANEHWSIEIRRKTQ